MVLRLHADDATAAVGARVNPNKKRREEKRIERHEFNIALPVLAYHCRGAKLANLDNNSISRSGSANNTMVKLA